MLRAKKAAIASLLAIGLAVTAVPSAEAGVTGPIGCQLPSKVLIASGPMKGWVRAWTNTSEYIWAHETGNPYVMKFFGGVIYPFDYHSVYFTCSP